MATRANRRDWPARLAGETGRRDGAARADPIESFHHGVNSLVEDTIFALYRDFPDPLRQRGQEMF
jgi:hypothetical protein